MRARCLYALEHKPLMEVALAAMKRDMASMGLPGLRPFQTGLLFVYTTDETTRGAKPELSRPLFRLEFRLQWRRLEVDGLLYGLGVRCDIILRRDYLLGEFGQTWYW